jgi:hypothetical protein
MLGRLSRASSQNSLNLEDPVPLRGMVSPINVPFENQNVDPTNTPSYQFTLEHPIGAILVKLAQDNTNLARRANLSGVETNISELCTSFHNAIKMQKADLDTRINRTTEDIENAIILKELNSHKINSSVNPPEHFSPTPTITSPQKLSEISKIFPRNMKFSGSKQDNNMSVVEFLNTLKSAQDQCKLSEAEFLDRMLAASTGLAHELLLEWKTNEENIPTIYHNLLINFDKRLSAEDAKLQLSAYKIPKSATLAKAESQIMLLSGRTASALPAGPSRTAYYNLEACNAMIRALPQSSSSIINNLYNQISARLGRAATFAELSRAMNLYRVTIDKDIKQNGTDMAFKNKRTFGNTGRNTTPGKQKFASYQMSVNTGRDSAQNPGYQNYKRAYNTSFTPRPKRNFPDNNKSSNNKSWNANRARTSAPNKRGADGKFARNNNKPPMNSGCSLCGYSNHTSKDCRNMRDDTGKQISMIATYGVCSRCPQRIQPRLHHPDAFCPFRPGGPLHNKQSNN